MTDCLYPVVQSAVMNDVIQSALAHLLGENMRVSANSGQSHPDNRPKTMHARSNPRNAGAKHIPAGARA